MSDPDLTVDQALDNLRHLTTCRCDEAYSGRGRHDPYEEGCEYAGEVAVVDGRPQGANCTPADKDTVDRLGLVHDWRDAERTDGVDDHHDWYLCIRCGCRDSD